MNVRLRNRIVIGVQTFLSLACLVLIGWAYWQADGGEHPIGMAVWLAGSAVFLAAFVLWIVISNRRSLRDVEDILRQSGVDPKQIPEEPIRLVPRFRDAANRNQLIAQLLFLVLLVIVFLAAYHAGGLDRLIERWAPPPRR